MPARSSDVSLRETWREPPRLTNSANIASVCTFQTAPPGAVGSMKVTRDAEPRERGGRALRVRCFDDERARRRAQHAHVLRGLFRRTTVLPLHRRRCATPSRACCRHAPRLKRHGGAPRAVPVALSGGGARACVVAFVPPPRPRGKAPIPAPAHPRRRLSLPPLPARLRSPGGTPATSPYPAAAPTRPCRPPAPSRALPAPPSATHLSRHRCQRACMTSCSHLRARAAPRVVGGGRGDCGRSRLLAPVRCPLTPPRVPPARPPPYAWPGAAPPSSAPGCPRTPCANPPLWLCSPSPPPAVAEAVGVCVGFARHGHR
eukprot:5678644-Pleurochrysis_carterae.AAC.2